MSPKRVIRAIVLFSFFAVASLSIAGQGGTPSASSNAVPAAPLLIPDALSLTDGALLGVESINAGGGADVFRIRYRSDGLAVIGYLLLPKAAQGRLPVLLFAHGGSGGTDKIGAAVLEYLSKLAERGGFVVLATDYRGTPGSEGRDEFGDADVDDVLNLIPVAEKLPLADTSKLVMLGYSRGAIETYVAIRKGAPLLAAAVVSGPTDLARTYRDAGLMIRHNIRSLIGGSPEEMPEAYVDRSALKWPEQLNVPLLILHGGKDDRVSAEEPQALDLRLTALGKPHKLRLFAEGRHMLHNVADARDQAILAWFDEHMQR